MEFLSCPTSLSARPKQLGFVAKDVNCEFPLAISEELACLPIQGTRISEAAFLHRPSRTLILCDSAFNMPDVFSGFERAFMRWNKVGGRFGPSRLTKWLFATDRKKLHASYLEILSRDFDRVIVNHGDIFKSAQSRNKLRK
jgi:hypothetical protein